MLILEMQGESNNQANEDTPADAITSWNGCIRSKRASGVSISQHVYSSPSVRRYAENLGSIWD